MTRPTAIVTGASRGIGKASAIALARVGFDVAITARTVTPGESRYPGSLEETADAIVEVGGRAHPVAMDLLDRERLAMAAREAIEALGRVDVLVNNAIYVSSAGRRAFLELDLDDVERRIFGNVTAQLRFMQPIVAHMVDRGGGVVLDMTSGAAYARPFAPADAGGWNLAYAVAKGGFHRIAHQLGFEYGDRGLRALNVQPGFVATERVRTDRGAVARIADSGVEPAVIGAALAHVATHADDYDTYETVELQAVAADLGLLDAPSGGADQE